MTNEEIIKIVSQITYKPGWKILFGIDGEGSSNPRAYAQISVDATTEASLDAASRDGTRTPWKGSKRYVSPYMCRQEIVGMCFGLIQDAESHEMREWFRYQGASIYNPHIDPDVLVSVARKKSSFNVRENAMTLEEPPVANTAAYDPKLRAYMEGVQADLEGKTAQDNPYHTADLRMAWQNGFRR
ncbi:ribosome modulation factor-like domain-containing protein [Rhizobium phage RHph_I4]|nr:ribosome modulation factor-like domain-containing protein [Rhizobium phage RHph_I4]